MRRSFCIAAAALLLFRAPADAQSLRGSPASLTRQNRAAQKNDFSFLANSQSVRRFVNAGLLVRVSASKNVGLADELSFPYARPEVKLFVERLGAQYRSACGERLVVTSLTRPWSRQPANASDRSVHPTGMALDLRRSARSSCRRWLENTLLELEGEGVIEATRERHPPHYHVAVFPIEYRQHVAQLTRRSTTRVAKATTQKPMAKGRVVTASVIPLPTHRAEKKVITYTVHRGDTLWEIARRNNTTVEVIKNVNNLDSGRIMPGQVLSVPTD